MTGTTSTPADKAALSRCFSCADDGQDYDVGLPTIQRLVALGWMEQTGRKRWAISLAGLVELGEWADAS